MTWTAKSHTQASPFHADELWGFTIIEDENGDTVATIYSTGPHSIDRDKQRGHARLIMKAPELLEALKDLLACAEIDGWSSQKAQDLIDAIQPKESTDAVL